MVLFLYLVIVMVLCLYLVKQHGWSFSRLWLNSIEDEIVSLVRLKLVHFLVDVVHPLHDLLDLLLSSGVDTGLGDKTLVYSGDFHFFN